MVARDGIGRGHDIENTQLIDSTSGQKAYNGPNADSIVRLLYGEFFKNFPSAARQSLAPIADEDPQRSRLCHAA